MQKIIAANWKMYKTRPEAAQTAAELALALADGTPHDRLVLVFPPFMAVDVVAEVFTGKKNLAVGGQNFYPAGQGAFTGEISTGMLNDVGATWVLVGHSERRHVFNESDELIARKTAFALAQGFKVMLCVGEMLHEREAGRLRDVLSRQLSTALDPLPEALSGALAERLVAAYEPVWAIGTGKVAGPVEVQEAHAALRALLADILGETAAELPILYGGSVKPANAFGLVGLDNVDGLLVGASSLEAQSFLQIIGS